MFRFMHMADVHLDTPFKNRDKERRTMLRECQREAFKAAVDLAVGLKLDAVLIAGDLFDNDTLSFATEKFLLSEMDRLNESGIDVFYSPGNHDPYGGSARMSNLHFPGNVHVFRSSSPELCNVSDGDGNLKAVIAGAGHRGPREDKNIAASFPEAHGSVPYIGLLHTFVTGAKNASNHDRYAPCTLRDLIDKGYSYWALGHIHERCELYSDPHIIYPGNIIGRNHGEQGLKGAYIVAIDDAGKVDAEFRALSKVCWETVEVTGLDNVNDPAALEKQLYKRALEYMDQKPDDCRLFLRIAIDGPCRLYDELKNEEELEYLSSSLKNTLGVEDVEVTAAHITRAVDIEKYRNGPHILGEVLSLIGKLKEDDELLMSLCPDELAGLKYESNVDRVAYLRRLIEGLDYEAAARLKKEGQK